ncbi:hypothetical protein QJS83_13095 [Bdellovibrio sp. 22V]|uniref:hypothetical protein n=1 Tax=Bdellovibrio TaxID=958 RepID=UPI00254366F1|nr:hypothetical protein [Bdellovibrio sp. 22V]WII71399.1 hypothetical protein QJS83_13095 [Bdellovibrio sp. 22V]
MKFVLALLAAATLLASTMAHATEEITNISNIQEPFVIEPIEYGLQISCPPMHERVVKYCWLNPSTGGRLVRCGYVCKPIRGGGEPEPSMSSTAQE